MSLTIDLWNLATGAAAGAVAVVAARGRNRVVTGAFIGAAVALLLAILQGII